MAIAAVMPGSVGPLGGRRSTAGPHDAYPRTVPRLRCRPDIGNPAGFDIGTVLTGSGVTLLVSAAITQYGEQVRFTAAEPYGTSGAALVVLGLVFGLVLVVYGYR